MKIKFSTIVKLFFISAIFGVGISYSKLYFFHIMLIILIFFYLYKNNYTLIIRELPTNYHYIFYIMLFWYTISIMWSLNKIYSIQFLFYIICGISIVLIMIYYCDNQEKQVELFNIFSVIFAFEIILCFLEALKIFRWPISPFSYYVKYFGRSIKFDPNLPSNILNKIFSMPTGFQWNPNNLATAMVIIFPFFILNRNIIIKIVGFFLIFFIVYKTDSRANLFALIVEIFSYFIFINKKRYLYIILIIFIILLLILNFNIIYEIFYNSQNEILIKISGVFNTLKDFINLNFYGNLGNSVNIRKKLILNGLEFLKKSYFLGVGAGNSKYIQELEGGFATYGITSMHFFWFEILVDTGIIFFIILMGWYFKILLKLYLIYKKSTINFVLKYFSSSSFISMIGFFVGCISASSVIYFFPMWILFGFSLVTINNYVLYNRENY